MGVEMKERLCYISDTVGWVDGNPDGILKKKAAQMELLAEHFDVVMLGFDQSHRHIGIRKADGKFYPIKDVPENIFGKTLKRELFYRMAASYCRRKKIRRVYVRYALTDPSFLRFLRSLPKDSDVMVEIPTYPYDKERAQNIRGKILSAEDKLLMPRLRKYVDYIATYSKDAEIAGVPCVNMQNGVVVGNIKMREINTDPNEIRLLAVASMNFWHGYDRIILGMGAYKKKGGERRIVLHLVGDGPEVPNLKKMAEEQGVLEDVIFHGFKGGAELDEISFMCDIAVTNLGLHRLGLEQASPLKVREYMAQGFPMISVSSVDISDLLEGHQLLVPVGDDPVDMEDIISFYNEKDLGNPESAKKEAEELRKLALKYCDMRVVFAPAVKAFLED